MKTVPVALLILSLAAGCVAAGATPPDVGNFKGQSSQPIIAKLGKPDAAEQAGGGTVFRWRTQVRQESAPVRVTRTDYSSGLPRQVETTVFQPQMQYCTLVLAVDGAGMVSDFTREGSRQACAPLLDRLGG